jgi:hypothetical protein
MPASMSERGAELRAMAFDFVQETEYFLAMFTDSPAEALDKDSEAVRAELVSRYTTAAEALRQEFTKPSTYKRRVETVFRSMNGDEFAAAVVVRQMTAIWSLACESGHDATVPEGLRLLGMRYAHRLLERGFAAGDERLVAFVRAND